MAVAGGLLLLGAWSALAVRADGPSLERVEESWLWTTEERDQVRQSLEFAGADAGVRRVALYDELSARARSRTPPFAYVRRDGYGIRPNINAALWSHRTHRGSAIVVIDPADADGKEREIFTTTDGFIFDIHPSFDGRKLLMTYKEDVSAPFHIWEIHVDGTGLRQITNGPYHDVTPLYYPDGRIVFASSRSEQYAMCQDFLAFTLYICDADGGDIRRIAHDTLCSVSPGLMNDGTIASSRWEYMDKTLWTWQGLWTVHPNGRMLQLLYGQTLNQPEALYAPRAIPGSHKVLFLMVGHYGAPIGDLAVVDRRLGVESPEAARALTNHQPFEFERGEWRRTRSRGPGSHGEGYTDPWPFRRELTLASFGGHPSGRASIVLVDHGGLVYPLHTDPAGDAYSPVSLAPRARGHTIPGDAPQGAGSGTFYVQDVYQGLIEQGVERGQVKGLRIWRQVPKKYNTEGPRIHDHYPLIGWGTYYVKELYGTVPVPKDGSIIFQAPANVELYFSAVDDKGREIQRMGTVTQIPPDATIGCVGCHEPRTRAPSAMDRMPRAWSKPPSIPAPPPWAEDRDSEREQGEGHPIDYVAQVQPIWDRHCTGCHNPEDRKGGIDLSGDKSRFFNMSYESLVVRNSGLGYSHDRKYVDYFFHGYGPGGTFPALKTGSMASSVVDMLLEGHSDTQLSPEEIETVAIWIDANVPYYGTWEMSRPRSPGGRDPFFAPGENSWSDFDTAPPRRDLKRGEWVETIERVLNDTGIEWSWNQSDMLNLTQPEYSRVLKENLSQHAGGRADPATAVFRTTDDPRYQRLLGAIQEGANALARVPRVDMPNARPIPQPREFDRVF